MGYYNFGFDIFAVIFGMYCFLTGNGYDVHLYITLLYMAVDLVYEMTHHPFSESAMFIFHHVIVLLGFGDLCFLNYEFKSVEEASFVLMLFEISTGFLNLMEVQNEIVWKIGFVISFIVFRICIGLPMISGIVLRNLRSQKYFRSLMWLCHYPMNFYWLSKIVATSYGVIVLKNPIE